ncbi:MAG: hypothetical protein HYW89_03260 [Candidatus Sungiibacteriota bacterium]|uniref:Toxin YoeB n=1 Tax=Candidatus Sungiibacteriota bacterium TaxID=2750080 RepID=A0A7T5RJ03_9BACT|nr:MAG: hypothetical protein HYW89_03260 [Candidatus Sungbacteria bacterium]
MNILQIHQGILEYVRKRGFEAKFRKQCLIFAQNPFHPGLDTKLLEPSKMRIWSFRIDRKYRAIFIFRGKDTIEIIDVNNHYQ